MSTAWILLIVAGSVVLLVAIGLFVAWAVWSSRQERAAAERARVDFASRFGLTAETRPGPYGRDPMLCGVLEGVPLEIGEVWRRGGSRRGPRRLTQWKFLSPTPWPGGLVAYTPGFRRAIGGPWGKVHDSTDDVRSLFSGVNDYELGDPELDPILAIDALDLGLVRALLLSPDVKAAILHAAKTFRHVRIRDREVSIEIERRARSVDELVEGARSVAAIARALGNACAQLAPATR